MTSGQNLVNQDYLHRIANFGIRLVNIFSKRNSFLVAPNVKNVCWTFEWNTWNNWSNGTHDEILLLFAHVLWTLKCIFSRSHGKLFSMLFQTITFSIYTLSDLGVLSNLIGSLSLANEHYSPPTKPNKNKMAGVSAWIERSIKSIFNGFLLKMLLRSLPVYILEQIYRFRLA